MLCRLAKLRVLVLQVPVSAALANMCSNSGLLHGAEDVGGCFAALNTLSLSSNAEVQVCIHPRLHHPPACNTFLGEFCDPVWAANQPDPCHFLLGTVGFFLLLQKWERAVADSTASLSSSTDMHPPPPPSLVYMKKDAVLTCKCSQGVVRD